MRLPIHEEDAELWDSLSTFLSLMEPGTLDVLDILYLAWTYIDPNRGNHSSGLDESIF